MLCPKPHRGNNRLSVNYFDCRENAPINLSPYIKCCAYQAFFLKSVVCAQRFAYLCL